jgi:nucleoside-diphosphate-sugar epimerase
MESGQQTKPRLALVVGATGGIGREVARALAAQGWRVRALNRDPQRAALRGPTDCDIEWVHGDAMSAEDYRRAATGASVIVHAANPPRYQRWRELAIPMLDNACAAARASSARLVLPGNVYNYGPRDWSLLTEDTPQRPETKKGQIRVEMEAAVRLACADGAMRALVVRAGDYFGPGHRDSWIATLMVRPGRPLASVRYPGAPDAGHAWAYLPDLAAAIARLIEIEAELPDFETFHFAGHWFEHGIDMADALRRVAQRPAAPVKKMPWWLLRASAPIVPLFREILEMRYLWLNSVRLDNRKLVARLGSEPHTPLDTALGETLSALGCIAA